MFTGLIQTVGSVVALRRRAGSARLVLRAPFEDGALELGESIAVDGACLTVAKCVPRGFEADLSSETLARTTAGTWRPGRRINLERALTPGSRLGGHFVQGHVDGCGRVAMLSAGRGQTTIRVQIPDPLLPLVAEKGSIALDGVSLTVSALGEDWFESALIPHTLEDTNLSERNPGDLVNIEVDLLARHIARLLALRTGQSDRPPNPKATRVRSAGQGVHNRLSSRRR